MKVVSGDGTRIAYERRGDGPALVIVHGTGIDHSYWDPVVPGLERHFTLYVLDRRGRGKSGDAAPYAIQREVGDVATMVESVPGRAFLLGHSYGALCSLEAALLTTRIATMILNEPPMHTTVDVAYPAEARERFLAYVGAGDPEKDLLTLYEAGGTSPEELQVLRSLSNWPARIAAVPTMLREIESARNYAFDPSRFENMKTPTLLLVGGRTAPVYRAAIETLHASLPNNRLVVMSGQGHDAAITAPERYVNRCSASSSATAPRIRIEDEILSQVMGWRNRLLVGGVWGGSVRADRELTKRQGHRSCCRAEDLHALSAQIGDVNHLCDSFIVRAISATFLLDYEPKPLEYADRPTMGEPGLDDPVAKDRCDSRGRCGSRRR